MNRLAACATILPALLLLALEARATIIGGALTGGTALTAGGTFVKLTPPLSNPFGPPNSVGNDTFQSPNLFGFDETQNVSIGPGGLSADVIAGGGSGTIPEGTQVSSHYVFFDPGPSQSQLGHVNFDADILAVMTSVGTLSASDFLAAAGVNYLSPSLRGLEAGDSAIIDPANPSQLDLSWVAGSPGDYVRVLTANSPVAAAPDAASTLLLLGCGIAIVGGLRCALLGFPGKCRG